MARLALLAAALLLAPAHAQPTCPTAVPALAPADISCYEGVSVMPDAMILDSAPGSRMCVALTITCGPQVAGLTGLEATVAAPCSSPNAVEGARVRRYKGLPDYALASVVALPAGTPGVFSELFLCNYAGCNAPANSSCADAAGATSTPPPAASAAPAATAGGAPPCPSALPTPASLTSPLSCVSGFAADGMPPVVVSTVANGAELCVAYTLVDASTGVPTRVFAPVENRAAATTLLALYQDVFVCATNDCNTPLASACGAVRLPSASPSPGPNACTATLPPTVPAGDISCYVGSSAQFGFAPLTTATSDARSGGSGGFKVCVAATLQPNASAPAVRMYSGVNASEAQMIVAAAAAGLYQDVLICHTPNCNSVANSNCGRANFTLPGVPAASSATPSATQPPAAITAPAATAAPQPSPVPAHFVAFGPSVADLVVHAGDFIARSLPLSVPIAGINLTTASVSTCECGVSWVVVLSRRVGAAVGRLTAG